MALYDRLLHAWGSKPQLRIAVTGTTSSGKSYLLRDLITALERHSTIGDGKRSNPLFNTILQLKNQLMHIEKTAMFPMRQDDVYADHVTIGGKTVEVLLADIPGECFTSDNLTMFSSIYEALLECDQKIFGLRQWTKGDNKTRTTVFVRGGEYTPAAEDISDGNDYAVKSRNRYIDNGNVFKELQRAGYVPEGKEELVDGKGLLDNFWKLEVDTVVNAIDAAWNQLEISRMLNRNHSAMDRRSFTDTAARLAFTPLLYAVTATDIVVSDLMATQGRLSDKARDRALSANDDFSTMLHTLQQLNKMADGGKHWYLALKGVDSLIKADTMGKVYEDGQRDANFVYSWLTMAFARHFMGKRLSFNNDMEFHLTLSNSVAIVDKRHDDDGNPIEVARLRRNYNFSSNYFLKADEFTVMSLGKSDTGTVGQLKLKRHIDLRDREFRALTGYQGGGDGCAAIGLAPHTFLVGHPIDMDFRIYGKSDDTHFSSEWDTAVPLALGTTQLLTDILLQHDLDPGCDYGTLLSYFFGNK